MANLVKNVVSLFTFVVTGWSLKLFVPESQANEKSNLGVSYKQLAIANNLSWEEALKVRVPKGSNWAIELHCLMDDLRFTFTLTQRHVGMSDITQALTIEEIKQGLQRDCRNTPFRDFLVGAFFGRGVKFKLHNVRGLFTDDKSGKVTFRCTDGTRTKSGYAQTPVYADPSFDITDGETDVYTPFANMKFLPQSMQSKTYENLNSVASIRIKPDKATSVLGGGARETMPAIIPLVEGGTPSDQVEI